MLGEWDAELERRSRAFAGHAAALSRWDGHILDNRRALLAVEEELCKARALGLRRVSFAIPYRHLQTFDAAPLVACCGVSCPIF